MDENNVNVNAQSPPNPAEIPTEVQKLQEMLDEAKEKFIRSVYRSIDYESLFTIIKQPEKHAEFKAYVQDYEEKQSAILKEYEDACKKASENGEPEPEKPKFDSPRPWTTFLDKKPVDADSVGFIWDQLLSISTNLALAGAELISTTLYDAFTAPQFMNAQKQYEEFARALGEFARRLEKLENPKVSNE